MAMPEVQSVVVVVVVVFRQLALIAMGIAEVHLVGEQPVLQVQVLEVEVEEQVVLSVLEEH